MGCGGGVGTALHALFYELLLVQYVCTCEDDCLSLMWQVILFTEILCFVSMTALAFFCNNTLSNYC